MVSCKLTEAKNRTQCRRLYKTFCFHKGRGKWQFVEVCKGTKTVPLPLLCALSSRRRKGNPPPSPGQRETPPVGLRRQPPLRGGQKSLAPAVFSATRQSEHSPVAVKGSAVQIGDHGANCFGHARCEPTEPPRRNSRREFTSAVVPHRFLHRNFVEVCKGTKAVPLPLLCALSSRRRKGNPLHRDSGKTQ